MISDNGLPVTNPLFQYIAYLFTAVLCYGITPTCFMLPKLVPIPKTKKYLSKCTLLNLYYAYIYPYMTYCIEIWFAYY